MPGSVNRSSVVAWAAGTAAEFDVAVGNPPFVRYQFVNQADRGAALDLGHRLGVTLAGVANLWIPVLLGALSRLAPGGVFSFVVPTECFTGVSAGVVRSWVLRSFDSVRFDHFPPNSFPGVLQEVGVLSGRRATEPRAQSRLSLVEYDRAGRTRVTTHYVPAAALSWTRYMLGATALEALNVASDSALVAPLGAAVSFEVSIVTGANDFFSASQATVEAYSLSPWARPLLPRIRHAPGLVLTSDDMRAAKQLGARTTLLDFSVERPDPMLDPGARKYLLEGVSRELPERYKCRIREPWFRVPGIKRGSLLLSKRSHDYPRVVINSAGVFTTDTIYRGEVTAGIPPGAVAASFHNSMTLLSAELEGRSFGGGVLELVPSEIARLAFPILDDAGAHLAELDYVARRRSPDALVRATDAVVAKAIGVDAAVIDVLDSARREIRDRRFARNRRAEAILNPSTDRSKRHRRC